MFEVVESMSEPVRMIAAPNSYFKPGLQAEVKMVNGTVTCGIAIGNQSFGVIGTEFISGREISFAEEDMIDVYSTRMIFRTSVFDIIASYETGDGLYCDEDGVFTTRKMSDDIIPVGRMISPPCIEHGYFEALWL